MSNKERDEAQTRKTKTEVRGDDSLQRPADPPKIGDFKPRPTPGPQSNNDDEHGPVTKLKWQSAPPHGHSELTADDEISRIVEEEERRNRETNGALKKARTGS